MGVTSSLEIADGSAVGAWIGAELTGPGGSVTGSVPARYEKYVRVLHPASLGDESITWARVAGELGTTVHPLAQWDAIVGADRYRNESPDWPGGEPETGSLDGELLGPLLETLGEHTGTPGKIFFGIWRGMTWGTVVAVPSPWDGDAPEALPWRSTDDLSFAFPEDQVSRPSLQLPGRDYVVVTGTLESGIQVEGWLSPSSPNPIWSEDRSWFLVSEIDFDSTLVGGTEGLARKILEDRRLEAFEVEPYDLLTWNADKINPPLPGSDESDSAP